MKYVFFILLLFVTVSAQEQPAFKIGRLKYGGGGDWYNDPSAEVNLLNFVKEHTNVKVKAVYTPVDVSTDEIFSFPFIFITGHGNIVLSDDEAGRLRRYVEKGGFIYIDDDYGFDAPIRREMKKVFPDKDFIELPFSHKLYHIVYDFNAGPPKTHEHDNKPPQGFGIFIGERLGVYYTYESNPGDGWADPDVHNDPQDKREEALKFGVNIIVYSLSN